MPHRGATCELDGTFLKASTRKDTQRDTMETLTKPITEGLEKTGNGWRLEQNAKTRREIIEQAWNSPRRVDDCYRWGNTFVLWKKGATKSTDLLNKQTHIGGRPREHDDGRRSDMSRVLSRNIQGTGFNIILKAVKDLDEDEVKILLGLTLGSRGVMAGTLKSCREFQIGVVALAYDTTGVCAGVDQATLVGWVLVNEDSIHHPALNCNVKKEAMFFVKPKQRRRGIGKLLYQAATLIAGEEPNVYKHNRTSSLFFETVNAKRTINYWYKEE
jgi:GNAT superfamily N-acetyltransferase